MINQYVSTLYMKSKAVGAVTSVFGVHVCLDILFVIIQHCNLIHVEMRTKLATAENLKTVDCIFLQAIKFEITLDTCSCI